MVGLGNTFATAARLCDRPAGEPVSNCCQSAGSSRHEPGGRTPRSSGMGATISSLEHGAFQGQGEVAPTLVWVMYFFQGCMLTLEDSTDRVQAGPRAVQPNCGLSQGFLTTTCSCITQLSSSDCADCGISVHVQLAGNVSCPQPAGLRNC